MKVEIKDGNFFYSQDIPSFFYLFTKRFQTTIDRLSVLLLTESPQIKRR